MSKQMKHLPGINPYLRCNDLPKVFDGKDFPKLSPFASWPGAMINSPWLDCSKLSPRVKDISPIFLEASNNVFFGFLQSV